MTFLLIAAALGALVGGWVGYKVGRTTERIRPTKREEENRKKLPAR